MNLKKCLAVSAAAVSVCVLLTACGMTALDPKVFCDIDVKGANGYGKIVITPDYDDLEDDIVDALGKDSTKKERQAAAEFARKIKFEVISDDSENLSNGDIVEIGVEYDVDDAKEDFKFKFKTDSFKYKVEGLDDAEPVDPFEGLEIEYSGFSPKASYKLSNKECDDIVRNNFYYEVEDDDREYVANGDTIKVKAICKDEDALLEEGYVMSAETKNFVVSGVEEGKMIDPFDGLVIEYTGISPQAQANINTTDCDEYVKNNVSFRIENNGNIANGEKVTVYARYDEYKADQNGIVITADEKSFTAEGVPVYLSTTDGVDLSSIHTEFKELAEQKLANGQLYKGSDNQYMNYIIDDSSCRYLVEDMKFVPVKSILLVSKNMQNSSTKCRYVVLFRVDGSYKKTDKNRYCKCGIEDGAVVNASFYVECYASNIAVNADGTINKDSMSSIHYDRYMPYNYADYIVPIDTVCEKWRTQNVSDFNVTVNDIT